jgi:hypothetical protein
MGVTMVETSQARTESFTLQDLRLWGKLHLLGPGYALVGHEGGSGGNLFVARVPHQDLGLEVLLGAALGQLSGGEGPWLHPPLEEGREVAVPIHGEGVGLEVETVWPSFFQRRNLYPGLGVAVRVNWEPSS